MLSDSAQPPIDAVISWVDGYEPAYQQKLAGYCIKRGIEQKKVIEPTRIQQCGEIHYCLHSLRRFAPWLRTIYIVTDDQVPSSLAELQNTEFGQKIKIINLRDLFVGFEACFPVFNSLTIEWLLWKIDGLSSHFLYFNDDVCLVRPVNPEDFFQSNRMVLRGRWKTQSDKKWLYLMKRQLKALLGQTEPAPIRNPHRHWQEKSARRAGWNERFYLLPHAPFPLIKQTFKDFIDQNPSVFADNIRFPFRHLEQMSAIPLMVHLDMKHNRTTFDATRQAITVNGACHSLKKIKSRLHQVKTNKQIAFICVQSLDQASVATQEILIQWLEETILEG
ncbi:MAG: hypothetical protein ACHP65_03110 [Legionellales bacterium]